MIASFADRQAEALFHRRPVLKLPGNIQRTAMRKLVYRHQARSLNDLRSPPGNRDGQHSIHINNQWRICFAWRNGDAHDVEIVDYH